jgi:hypothetical protein
MTGIRKTYGFRTRSMRKPPTRARKPLPAAVKKRMWWGASSPPGRTAAAGSVTPVQRASGAPLEKPAA